MTLPVAAAARADARQARRASCRPPATVSYEPKWDGFRCIVFRDGDDLDLQSRNQKPLLRYFPELREPLLAQLPERVVLDGELVVANDTRPRLRRAATAPASRRVAREEARGRDPGVVRRVRPARARATSRCSTRRSSERRARLEAMLGDATPPLYLTPATPTATSRADWFSPLRGRGLRRRGREAARRHVPARASARCSR